MVFEHLRIYSVDNIIHFAVSMAALVLHDFILYSTRRMLYNLFLQGSAPQDFSKRSSWKVPY